MGEFWNIMNVLVGPEWKKVDDDFDEWVNYIIKKRKDVNSGSQQLVQIPSFCSSFLTIEIQEEEVRQFWKKINLPRVECKFPYPDDQYQPLELMGSNYVNLVDRDFMQDLQNKISREYMQKMNDRIKYREGEELGRVKSLVLNGKIPLKFAPEEMASHPIMFLEPYMHTEEKRQKKIKTIKTPSTSRSNDLKTPSLLLTNHGNGTSLQQVCRDSKNSIDGILIEISPPSEYENFKNESLLVKQLRNSESVEEMYNLAEEIIGEVHNTDTSKSTDDTSNL